MTEMCIRKLPQMSRADADRIEAALKPLGCWLSPGGDGSRVVAASKARDGQGEATRELERRVNAVVDEILATL